jgi:(1->4)-alpha-D-glucan 1-alpha-D-glucosylmutase
MTTTTTHDTKRSEDVRARLAVLSEVPSAWERFVEDIDQVTQRNASGVSASDAYVFYQNLVGAFPMGDPSPEGMSELTSRMADFMRKATREAKLATSWMTPNEAYEKAVDDFVKRALSSADFVARVRAFVAHVAPYGACNSLAQLALRLASPGVPDIYQGNELWDLSLVDPDNRRPVDFARRRALLANLQQKPTPELARELVGSFADGRIKMHVTRTGLRFRRDHAQLFLEGGYDPIGESKHVVAFERRLDGKRLLCVVPRLSRTLSRGDQPWPIGDIWRDETLTVPGEGGKFTNVFTGEQVDGKRLLVKDVLASFPVAWLVDGNDARGSPPQ